MPQGLSAGPQRPTRPGLAGGQHKGDWPRASGPTSARPRERPAQRGHVSQPGTAPPKPQQHPNSRRQQNQDRRAASATTNAPAVLSKTVPRLPKTSPFCASRGSADLPPQARRVRRSDFLSERWKRLPGNRRQGQQAVSKHAVRCIDMREEKVLISADRACVWGCDRNRLSVPSGLSPLNPCQSAHDQPP